MPDVTITKPEASATAQPQTVCVSLGTDIRKPQELTEWPLSDIMFRIQSGTYRAAIEKIRKQENPEQAKQLKLNLPYFIMGKLKGKRCEENVTESSGLVLDFDNVADAEILAQSLKAEIPYVRYAFLSPRNGIKAVVLFSSPVKDAAQYARIWNRLIWEIEQQTGYKADNTPDRSRACFVSYDPNLVDNHAAIPFPVEDYAVVQDANPAKDTGNSVESYAVAACCATEGCATEDCAVEEPLPETVFTGVWSSGHAEIDSQLQHIASETLDKTEVIPNLSEHYVKQALEHLCNCKISYRDWIRCGMALYNQYGAVKGLYYWSLFQHNPYYQDKAESLNKVWNSLGKYSSVGLASLFHIARVHGFNSVIYTGKDRNLEAFPELKYIYGEPEDVKLDINKLPEYMQNFLVHADKITDSSPGAKITALIPSLACNIGNRIGMHAAGQTVFCSVYAMIIGESGYSRKTTTLNLAVNNIMDSHLQSLKDMVAKDRNNASIIVKNTTHARLLELLSIDSIRLIVKNEMAGWLQDMNKSYNSGMMLDLTNLYDGQSQSIAKMEVDAWINHPALSILGATTPEALFKELKNSSDRNNGFLPRFLYCFIRNVDLEGLNFDSRNTKAPEDEIKKLGEVVEVFRNLTGRHILSMNHETELWRQEIYTKKFKQALKNKRGDSTTSYFTRIYDGYWYKLCILGFAMKHWQEMKEADENCRLKRFFDTNKLDLDTAKEAMYLCDYYFENAMPVMVSFSEGSRLQDEKNIVSLIRNTVHDKDISHSRLLTASRMNGRDFNTCINSLVDKQAVIAMDIGVGYNNRIARQYRLNPVLL